MGWGGKRAGAGRKPLLNSVQRLRIGAECERRWQALAGARSKSEFDRVLGGTFDATELLPLPRREGWLETELGEDHVDHVRYRLCKLQRLEADGAADPARLITIPYRRPKGCRSAILNAVADWASATYATAILPSLVDVCWKEARRLRGELADPA